MSCNTPVLPPAPSGQVCGHRRCSHRLLLTCPEMLVDASSDGHRACYFPTGKKGKLQAQLCPRCQGWPCCPRRWWGRETVCGWSPLLGDTRGGRWHCAQAAQPARGWEMMAVVRNELGTRLAALFWLGEKAAEAAGGSQTGRPWCLLVFLSWHQQGPRGPPLWDDERMGTKPGPQPGIAKVIAAGGRLQGVGWCWRSTKQLQGLTQSTAQKRSGIKPSPLLTTREQPSFDPRTGSMLQGG